MEPLSPKSQSNITNDIALLMHSNGDISNPHTGAVELVEEIVRKQSHSLLHRLADVCNMKDTTTISQDEVLFLFRKNKIKLQRLLGHVKAKDLRTAVNKEVGGGEDGGYNSLDPSKGKKFRSCEQFLSQIDATGAYTSCLEGKEVDPARQRRLVRMDIMTRTMSEDQYMRYHESRQVSLTKRLKSPKVREYLFGDLEKFYKIATPALEMIVFCIQETVAEIVDMALELKKECRQTTDVVERLNPLPFTNQEGITADEIRECMRRFNHRNYILHPHRNRLSRDAVPLLCL